MKLPSLPSRVRLARLLPIGVGAILFLLPVALLTDAPVNRIQDRVSGIFETDPGVASDTAPVQVIDPLRLVDGPFALGPADLERQDWSWGRAKSLAVEIWESQVPGEGLISSYYCGCDILRRGDTGGTVDFASCGYAPRANPSRAERLEWEHVVPAAFIGRGRTCWSEGAPQCVGRDGEPFRGRDCCMIADPVFAMAATDPVNLVPAVGEVNGDRLDYLFGLVPGERRSYGQCDMEIDRGRDIAEPPTERRGDIARIWAYMSRAYGLSLPRETAELYRDWILQDPVDQEEVTINEAIARSGHRANPFVLRPSDAIGVRN